MLPRESNLGIGDQHFCGLPSYLGILGMNRNLSGRSHTGDPQPQDGTGTCRDHHISLGEHLPSYSHTLQRKRLSERPLCPNRLHTSPRFTAYVTETVRFMVGQPS